MVREKAPESSSMTFVFPAGTSTVVAAVRTRFVDPSHVIVSAAVPKAAKTDAHHH